MKISADLSTFEIVLFKTTLACIHTYFISIALCMLREAMGIIYVVQEERGIQEKRERNRKGETGRTPSTTNFITGQKPKRYMLN